MVLPVGRYTWRNTKVLLGAAAAKLASADPARVLIAFSLQGGATTHLCVGPALGRQYVATITVNGYVEFFWERHGALVTDQWSDDGTSAGTNVFVTEVIELEGCG